MAVFRDAYSCINSVLSPPFFPGVSLKQFLLLFASDGPVSFVDILAPGVQQNQSSFLVAWEMESRL